MPNFEDALRANLLGMNAKLEAVDNDLHQEVAFASEGVKRVTSGKLQLLLEPLSENDEGIRYNLLLCDETHDYSDSVATFEVRVNGYPIRAAPGSRYHQVIFLGKWTEINDRKGLADYFSQMASNPDSALVQKIAFLIRRLQRQEAR
jgi:hypothetical protein